MPPYENYLCKLYNLVYANFKSLIKLSKKYLVNALTFFVLSLYLIIEILEPVLKQRIWMFQNLETK
jgi:hypothetical protein